MRRTKGKRRRITGEDLGWLAGGHGGGTGWLLIAGIHAFWADARLGALTLISFFAANGCGLALYFWWRQERSGRMVLAMEGLVVVLLVFYMITILAFDLAGQRGLLKFYDLGRSPYSMLWVFAILMLIPLFWARQKKGAHCPVKERDSFSDRRTP